MHHLVTHDKKVYCKKSILNLSIVLQKLIIGKEIFTCTSSSRVKYTKIKYQKVSLRYLKN
ncbi:hypothetical protein KUTeg_005158 [Tegillarca granosa]|uniref:Uncharacterized protein n=1 Tax=Tegillarca granosa TaxID=220873 RepID=A0ABQ9FJ00_TEGGR|nr:hypothetical protein KUTeg_005158 [Tegillarca granosa]